MISLMSYFCMMLKFMMSKNHLLMGLLSLEGMMIIMMYWMIGGFMMGLLNVMSIMLFSVVMVGEGAMGLGLLVMLVRGVGSDKFYFLNML